jgi:hypothetical protein
VKKVDESVREQQACSSHVQASLLRENVGHQQDGRPHQQHKRTPEGKDIIVEYHPDGGGEKHQRYEPKEVMNIFGLSCHILIWIPNAFCGKSTKNWPYKNGSLTIGVSGSSIG